MFKVSKKTHQNNMSNVLKVNNKDTRTTSGASIVNAEHISQFIVIIAEFEQINAGWAQETIVPDNKFILSNCGKHCPMGWENLLGSMFLSLFTQHKVAKGYFFTTALPKDKSKPEVMHLTMTVVYYPLEKSLSCHQYLIC